MSRKETRRLSERIEAAAEDLRVIGGFIDRCDQLDLMPADEVGVALQSLVNVQHVLGQAREAVVRHA